MMRKKLVMLVIGALLVLGAVGAVFWFFKILPINTPQDSEMDEVENFKKPPASIENKPPQGYEVFQDNSPEMRAELRADLTKKFSETVEELKKDPLNSSLWVDLGAVKYSFNDFDGAEAVWKYAIEINPLADIARMNLAVLYQYKAPNYQEAERLLKIVIENRPPNVMQMYSELFDLYRYRYAEKSHLAEGVMLEAYREFPDQHAVLKTLAWHFLEQENKAKAIEYFEKYLEKVPNDESALEELSRLR